MLDQALAQLEESFVVFEELSNNFLTALVLFDLVSVTLDQNDPDRAQRYLQRLQRLNEQEDNKMIEQQYRLANALMLKASPRIRDKGQAQTLFQQLIEEEPVRIRFVESALVHLCELLLDELKAYGEPVVFQEAQDAVQRLAVLAKGQKKLSLVIHLLILQAKFALIEGKLTAAERFLKQAKATAEEKSLGLLLKKVTTEQELLKTQFNQWRQLIQDNASFEERLEQARLTEYLKAAQHLIRMETREPPS